MSDLSDDIAEVAAGPKQTNVDGTSTTEHGLGEMIEADRYLKERTAGSRSRLPIRITRSKPPGTV